MSLVKELIVGLLLKSDNVDPVHKLKIFLEKFSFIEKISLQKM